MRETTKQIEAHIEDKYKTLRSNFDELEDKVESATDWRKAFARHPGAMVAAAFGAGALLAVLTGRRSAGPGQAESSAEPHASATPLAASAHRRHGAAGQIWDPVREALIGVAVTQASGLLERLLASRHQEAKNKHGAQNGSVT